MIKREYAINQNDELNIYETRNIMSRRYYQLYRKMTFDPTITEGKRYKNLARSRVYIVDEFKHSYNVILTQYLSQKDKNEIKDLPTVFRTFNDIVENIRDIWCWQNVETSKCPRRLPTWRLVIISSGYMLGWLM